MGIPYSEKGQQPYIFEVMIHDDRATVSCRLYLFRFLNELHEVAQRNGYSLGSDSEIFITHHDPNHMSELAAFKREHPSIETSTRQAFMKLTNRYIND